LISEGAASSILPPGPSHRRALFVRNMVRSMRRGIEAIVAGLPL
jgi:hypothetical protein